MPRLTWDDTGKRLYETGVDRGVFYPLSEEGNGTYGTGEAWNGLSNVTESPSGAEPTAVYADNIKYLNLMSAEEFAATIEAYTYPAGFRACNGEKELVTGVTIGQQDRKTFGFSYRSLIGNDVDGTNHGYKIHLVYGAQAAPSEKSNATINDSPEAATMSWEVSTTPVNVNGFKPTAHLVIDSTEISPEALSALEDLLYGAASAGEGPTLPLPDKVLEVVNGAAEAAKSSLQNIPNETENSVD